MAIFWFGKISGLWTAFAVWMWNAPNPQPIIPIFAHILAIGFGFLAVQRLGELQRTNERKK